MRVVIKKLCMVLLVGFSSSVWSLTDAPLLINYQGTLRGADGALLPPTSAPILSFSIFQTEASTVPVWGPQTFDGGVGVGHGPMVAIVNGVFNVILGERDVNSKSIADAFTSDARYLEVTVGSQPILPRQRILSTPYALHSASSVPVGGMVMYFGEIADLPPNWVSCDGQTVVDPASKFNGAILPNPTYKYIRGVPGYTARSFIGTNIGGQAHRHGLQNSTTTADGNVQLKINPSVNQETFWARTPGTMASQGAHTHTTTITGATDNSYPPLPLSMYSYYICRIK